MRRVAIASRLLALLIVVSAVVPIPVVSGEWVNPGPVSELPEVVRRVAPEYPAAAREAGVEGTVLVQAFIDTAGNVGETRVTQSIPMLDRAALDCVRQWHFKPAISNGQAFGVWVGIPVRFKLTSGATKPDAVGLPPHLVLEVDPWHVLPAAEPLRPAAWPADWVWRGGTSRTFDPILLAEQVALERLPKVTHYASAEMPSDGIIRETHWKELVVALIRVESNGRVSAARIVQSEPGCDATALRAVQLWRFRPARQHGRSVPVLVYVPVYVRTW